MTTKTYLKNLTKKILDHFMSEKFDRALITISGLFILFAVVSVLLYITAIFMGITIILTSDTNPYFDGGFYLMMVKWSFLLALVPIFVLGVKKAIEVLFYEG